MSLNDQDLVSKVILRDRAACQEFVQRVCPVIHAAAARVFAQQPDRTRSMIGSVEDAVQQVFIHVWENDFARLRKYDATRGPLVGWMWTVAKNEISRSVRGAASQPHSEFSDDQTAEVPSSLPTPQDVEGRDALKRLWQELEQELDETDQALLQMRLLDEQPTAVVCAALRITPDALYQRVRRLKLLVNEIGRKLDL
jgi:RNA polymerase sigma factor (sigma-70 family)